MQLQSVNIGAERTQTKGDGFETTGIYKLPVGGSVEISELGIPADFIADSRHHGGPGQAVYVYGSDDYAWWSGALDRELAPGTFGENLTISGLASADYSIGDRLQIGSVTLEITSPRTPCAKLARRMGDPLFIKKYRRAERPGFYCRVIRKGFLQQGDPVSVERTGLDPVGVLELFRESFRRHKDEATLRRFLRAPIDGRTADDIERDLRELLAAH
jgi:MOSC domain-containing protein YiiM